MLFDFNPLKKEPQLFIWGPFQTSNRRNNITLK